MSCCKENTQSGWLSSSTDSTQTSCFSCCDSIRVNILMSIICGVCWFHPVHLSLTCSYIRARDINCSSDWIFLCQFKSILSCKSFDLFGWVISWIETDTALCSSVRNVNSGAFKSHQTSQSFNFVNIDIFCVSGSSFGWEFVCFMLASVCWNNFKTSVIYIKW